MSRLKTNLWETTSDGLELLKIIYQDRSDRVEVEFSEGTQATLYKRNDEGDWGHGPISAIDSHLAANLCDQQLYYWTQKKLDVIKHWHNMREK